MRGHPSPHRMNSTADKPNALKRVASPTRFNVFSLISLGFQPLAVRGELDGILDKFSQVLVG